MVILRLGKALSFAWILLCLFPFFAFSLPCSEVIESKLNEIENDQSPEVVSFEFKHGSEAGRIASIPVHQPGLVDLIREGAQNELSRDWINRVRAILEEHQVFDIPVSENGALIASGVQPNRGEGNGGGGMGTVVWGRDMVRAIKGMTSLGRKEVAKKMVIHMLKAMSTQPQLERLRQNLLDPSLHLQGPMKMPRVRWDGRTFDDVMVKNPVTGKLQPQPWNHMQFDFYVSALRTTMIALRDGIIEEADLTPNMRSFLIGMSALPLRLKYWKVHTSDAWEEGMAVRTSTVIQESTFYWLYLAGLQGESDSVRFSQLIQKWNSETLDVFFDKQTMSLIRQTLSVSPILEGLQESEVVINKQLPLGETPFGNSGAQTKRFEDAALLHALWFEGIKQVSRGQGVINLSDVEAILNHLKKLEGFSGISRYDQDVYLHPFFWVKDEEKISQQFGRTSSEIPGWLLRSTFALKDGHKIEDIFGKGFMAQWTLHDPMASSIHGDLALFYEDNAAYRERQRYHLLRSLGQISGTRAANEKIIAADGYENDSWQLTEAYILVRVFDKEGTMVKELYLPCPHSPLYWSVSELARALRVANLVVESEAQK